MAEHLKSGVTAGSPAATGQPQQCFLSWHNQHMWHVTLIWVKFYLIFPIITYLRCCWLIGRFDEYQIVWCFILQWPALVGLWHMNKVWQIIIIQIERFSPAHMFHSDLRTGFAPTAVRKRDVSKKLCLHQTRKVISVHDNMGHRTLPHALIYVRVYTQQI